MTVANANSIEYADLLGSSLAATVSDISQRGRHYLSCYVKADAAASTDLERVLMTVTPNYSGGIILYGAWLCPDAAVAHDGTNYSILQLGTRPQAGGGSQTAIGSTLDTSATDWVAVSQITLYSAPGGLLVAQNLGITIAKTHAGSGVVIPNMRVVLEFALN
jgi:hypothetical protein